MEKCLFGLFFLPNLCCLSKCKAVQQPTRKLFYCMNQGVDCMTWSEACGWKASFDRAGRLCRVKEMGSTAVSLCCLDSPSCVPPRRLCPGTDLPCQATWHWPCSTLKTNQYGWPPIQPVPWSPCVHQYNQSLSWYLFKHQGWSLDVQQTVPPVCRPTMLLMTEKGDLGGLDRWAMAKACGDAIPQFHQGPIQSGVLQGRLSLG